MQRLHNWLWLSIVVACGGTSALLPLDPPVTCRTGNCGKEEFRRAVPSKTSVRIDSPKQSGKPGARPLDAVSEDFEEVVDYVEGIDQVIDGAFGDLEYLIGETPEVAEDNLHRWRAQLEDGTGEGVLELQSADETTFTLAYSEGDAGFEPGSVDPILTGEITTTEAGLASFKLEFDLDADAVATNSDDSGKILIDGHPFQDEGREVFFDLVEVSIDNESPETSLTTYWRFDDGSDALEYIADIDDEQTTVYARWNDDGVGRYDHHVAYTDDDLGAVDEIATACWSDGGREVFDAEADFAEDGIHGVIDGDEDDCEFGPLDSHPNPGAEFANLPQEGEWDALELIAPGGEPGDGDAKRSHKLRPIANNHHSNHHLTRASASL